MHTFDHAGLISSAVLGTLGFTETFLLQEVAGLAGMQKHEQRPPGGKRGGRCEPLEPRDFEGSFKGDTGPCKAYVWAILAVCWL